MSRREYLVRQIDRARRLANATPDAALRDSLKALAAEYQLELDELGDNDERSLNGHD